MECNKKIYSLVVESAEQFYLSIQYAESLEEAFALAKVEHSMLSGVNNYNVFEGAKIWLFSITTIKSLIEKRNELRKEYKKVIGNDMEKIIKLEDKKDELLEDNKLKKTTEIIKKNIPIDKNKIMEKIIKDKDKTLLSKNKNLFTKNELKYIKEKISK